MKNLCKQINIKIGQRDLSCSEKVKKKTISYIEIQREITLEVSPTLTTRKLRILEKFFRWITHLINNIIKHDIKLQN